MRRLPVVEFVALMAILIASIAFSTDAMLPGLPDIAAELSPLNPNRAQLIVTSFMLGMGIGTFVSGPLADAFGRKFILTLGVVIFIFGAAIAYFAQSLETLLLARVLQGLGAAGPRIAPMAMVRDLYEGRRMAQILSFIMMAFMLVPAAAPSVGALIIDQWDWRAIFVAFIVFSLIGTVWLHLRQAETLAPENKRPFQFAMLKVGFIEVATNRLAIIYTITMTLGMSILLAVISSTQQVYDVTYGQAESFPKWFALTALVAATGTLVNAALVIRLGMRRLVMLAYAAQAVISIVALLMIEVGPYELADTFWVWFLWTTMMFFTVGMTFGNLTALALQPLGHIAGLAASLISAISTVVAVFVGGAVGLAFDGTPIPLMASATVLAVAAWWIIWSKSFDTEAETP